MEELNNIRYSNSETAKKSYQGLETLLSRDFYAAEKNTTYTIILPGKLSIFEEISLNCFLIIPSSNHYGKPNADFAAVTEENGINTS